MKFRRLGFVALTCLMVLSIFFAGCSKNNGTIENGSSQAPESIKPSSEPTATAVANETIDFSGLKFSFYGHYDWYTPPKWGSDPTTKWLLDNKQMEIDFVSSGGAAQQKLNTMIVSNEYPDVLWLDRTTDFNKLSAQGLLVPLDEYIEKYPNLKKFAGDNTLNMLKGDDGHIYGFPNWYTNDSVPTGNSGWMINTKVHKELGSPKLDTLADLESYLRQVKAKYPNIVPLEVGAGFNGDGVMLMTQLVDQPWQVWSGLRAVVDFESKEIKPLVADPRFKDFILYTNKLFRDGLITQDAFTQTSDQEAEKISNGRIAVLAGADMLNRIKLNTNLMAKEPGNSYEAIVPITKDGGDPFGVKLAQYTTLGWNVSVITKTAKDPEKIFAFMDWATGEEGQRLFTYGPQGLYWDEVDEQGVPIPNEKFNNTPKDQRDKDGLGSLNNWANTPVLDNYSKTREEKYIKAAADPATPAFNRMVEIKNKYTLNVNEFEYLTPLPESEEGVIKQKIDDLYKEGFAKMVFAKSDDEVLSILTKLISDMDKAGQEKLFDFSEKQWSKNREKLGK